MIESVETVLERPVSRETAAKLKTFVEVLIDENQHQNLVARSTIADIWTRHIADSAQLVPLSGRGSTWVDIGSGAGLPGLVIAILTGDPVTLVEPRRLRAEFLRRAANALDLSSVQIQESRAQSASGQFDVVTARAVAPAVELIGITRHLTHSRTRYLLMKGRNAQSELETVRGSWQGEFRLVPSRTSPDAAILLGDRVGARGGT